MKHQSEDKTRTYYICGVAWQHEIGSTRVNFYENLKDLKEFKKCTHECGIVKLIVQAEWIQEQKFGK